MSSHNDTAGQLLNSLSTGVSFTAAISEILDNSISAGSSKIHLNLSGSTLIISDNGCGMDRDKLEDSTWLNRRSISSNKRHGRFGLGKKQAEFKLTNLEGSATTFSSSGGKISQITTNYPRVLQAGVYAPQACGLECDSSHIWHKNAIDPSGNGTVSYICLSEVARREITELLCDDHPLNGLRFIIATTYCDALTNGLKITTQCGESNIHEVYPFDRLCSPKRDTPTMHYKAYEIDILQTIEEETASYYVKPTHGACQRFDQSKKKWVDVVAPASFDSDRIGSVTYEMAYSTDWHNLQKDDLKKNGITSLSDGQTGVEEQRIKTDGKELVRNGKVIKHSMYKYKNVTNSEKKVHKQTRERISFEANERMDDQVFKVQVNKFNVNESDIDPYLWKALEQLKDQFVKSTSSKLSPEAVEVQSSPHSSISSPQSPPSPPPPPSESTSFPSNTAKTKQARKIKTHIISHIISDTHSENETHNGRCAGVAAAIRVVRPVAVAGGGGPAIHTEIMPNFVPDSECIVGSSMHQFILRKTGENILAEWKRSGKYMATLDETLDKMHIEFSGNLAADTLKRYLNRIPLNEKYDLLLEMIREKYASPETRMKGIELQRIYNKTFEADIAAGVAKGM